MRCGWLSTAQVQLRGHLSRAEEVKAHNEAHVRCNATLNGFAPSLPEHSWFLGGADRAERASARRPKPQGRHPSKEPHEVKMWWNAVSPCFNATEWKPLRLRELHTRYTFAPLGCVTLTCN